MSALFVLAPDHKLTVTLGSVNGLVLHFLSLSQTILQLKPAILSRRSVVPLGHGALEVSDADDATRSSVELGAV